MRSWLSRHGGIGLWFLTVAGDGGGGKFGSRAGKKGSDFRLGHAQALARPEGAAEIARRLFQPAPAGRVSLTLAGSRQSDAMRAMRGIERAGSFAMVHSRSEVELSGRLTVRQSRSLRVPEKCWHRAAEPRRADRAAGRDRSSRRCWLPDRPRVRRKRAVRGAARFSECAALRRDCRRQNRSRPGAQALAQTIGIRIDAERRCSRDAGRNNGGDPVCAQSGLQQELSAQGPSKYSRARTAMERYRS